MDIRYIQKGETIFYTNTTDKVIDAGEVIEMNGIVGITNSYIMPNSLGVLSISGVFQFPKGKEEISIGQKVYYNKTNKLATTKANKNNILLGVCSEDVKSDNTYVLVKLQATTAGDNTQDIPIVCGSTNLGDINIDVKKLDIGKMYMYQCNYNAGHLPDGGGTGLRTILVYKLRDGYATMYVIPQCNADNKHLYQIVCDNNIWQFDKAVDLVGLSDSSNFAKLDDINTFTASNNFHEINCKGLSCGNKRVSGVADPLISSDAINKQTLDAGLEKKADLSGATFTGAIKDKNNRPFNCVYLGQLSDAHIDVSSLETGYIYAGQAYDKNCKNCPSGSNGL